MNESNSLRGKVTTTGFEPISYAKRIRPTIGLIRHLSFLYKYLK